MNDPATTRYLAANYPHLQGLRLVPVGLVFLASALWRAASASPALFGQPARLWFVVAMVLALAADYPIASVYRRRYGHIRFRLRRHVASVLVGALLVVGALWWPGILEPPVSWPIAAIGGLLISIAIRSHGLRIHYAALGGLWLLLAIGPGLPLPTQFLDVALDALIALTLIVGGVGDHFVLVRAMSPDENLGAQHAA